MFRLLLAGTANFYIAWGVDDGRGDFKLQVPFADVVRGRQLREAIAEAREEEAERLGLRLHRARRRRDGAAVVAVREEEREFCADEQGAEVAGGEREPYEWRNISDEDVIATRGPLHVWIDVWRK